MNVWYLYCDDVKKLEHITISGVVAIIYLAERMASAEREPITGVWGQSPQRGPGAEPLVGVRGGKGWKGFTFWTCNGNSKLALQLSVFRNWVNRCYSWYLSKTEVQSLQWSQVQSNSVYPVKNFSCWTAPIWGMNRYSRQQGNSLQFPCALCHIGLPGVSFIRYSGLGLLDNLLVCQNVKWKLLILVQYTTS